jgi:signal peptidase I
MRRSLRPWRCPAARSGLRKVPATLIVRTHSDSVIPQTHLEAACCNLVADVVRSTGTANLKVTGCSMLPAIRPGDVLTISRLDSHDLQSGDVVLYSRNGRLTAHRILKIANGSLMMRGDSLSAIDPPVRFEEVVGKVLSISRRGRKLSPRQSLSQTVAAYIIRRSEWCRRLYLRLSVKLEEFELLESKFEY